MIATRTGSKVALAEFVDKAWVVNKRTRHLYHLKALIKNALDTLTRYKTTNIYQWTLQLGTELLCILKEEALLEVVVFNHPLTKERNDNLLQPLVPAHVVTHSLCWDTTTHNGHRGTRNETRREYNTIYTELLNLLCNLDALWNLDAALETILHVVLNKNCHITLCSGLHNLSKAHLHKAHTILK